MKIQCDVCNKDEASVFCLADEAALCDGCDHRVHHANKLASKHQRFSLLHPSPKEFPLCDICQEKRAFLFCQQDRAILCRDCDGPIHKSNEHTQKHNRFLLTGVKLSAESDLYIPTSNTAAAALTNGCDSVPDCKSQPVSTKKPPPGFSDTSQIYHPPLIEKTSTPATVTTVTNKDNNNNNPLTTDHFGSTSSISEYLIEMLPGWHVEDILDSSSTASPSSFGLCKADNGVMPFIDTDFQSELSSFSSESMGIWVPQAPSQLAQASHYSSCINGQIGFKENNEATSLKANRRWCDDGFTVPQISLPSNGSKRSRSSW